MSKKSSSSVHPLSVDSLYNAEAADSGVTVAVLGASDAGAAALSEYGFVDDAPYVEERGADPLGEVDEDYFDEMDTYDRSFGGISVEEVCIAFDLR